MEDLNRWINQLSNRPIQVFVTSEELASAIAPNMKEELDKMELRDVSYSY